MPTISVSVTKDQKEKLLARAEEAGVTLNKMLQSLVLGEAAATFNNSVINETETRTNNEEVTMTGNDNCPECLRHEMTLELKERDLDEARQEASYWQTQATKAGEELGRVSRIAQSLESQLNVDKHADIHSMLACPNCGPRTMAELPNALNKKQALSIARQRAPELFEPVRLKIK